MEFLNRNGSDEELLTRQKGAVLMVKGKGGGVGEGGGVIGVDL